MHELCIRDIGTKYFFFLPILQALILAFASWSCYFFPFLLFCSFHELSYKTGYILFYSTLVVIKQATPLR